ncbi:MAG: NADH-quinone oxidoreductase subunit J [Anaerolineaceae bacterium]|nr:NADH-quinone oxidoreductase subunit J [Anaerolineaceae bacterium]
MTFILIAAGAIICAVMAIRAGRLLTSALWLAATSALVALLMYMLGAPEVAVIELSVGAGLVTILFVFAINISGEEATNLKSALPKPLAWVSILIFFILLGYFSLPAFLQPLPEAQIIPLKTVLWEYRSLDVVLQAVLIFAGVLGLIGLLAEEKPGQEKEHQA